MITDFKYNLRVFPTIDILNIATTELIVTLAKKTIAERGKFVMSLSGGKTPKEIYSLLARPDFLKKINWEKVFIFWGDERCVPLNDRRNNAHEAISILFDKVPIPEKNIHRIEVNLSPHEAAMKYQKTLDVFFEDNPQRFDLVLLGLGENGHTASLFPGTNVINDHTTGVREVYVDAEKMFRITMTAPLINQARHILFLVTGKNKADILKKVLKGPFQPDLYPAQLIQPLHGELWWHADKDAASRWN